MAKESMVWMPTVAVLSSMPLNALVRGLVCEACWPSIAN